MSETEVTHDRHESFMARLRRAGRRLDPEQRLAAIGALLLVVSEFLPWYTNDFQIGGGVRTVTQTALQAASLVELALFIIAGAVVVMLFLRAEGRDIHLPASDGTLLAAAGGWSTLMIFIRMLDRPAATVDQLSLRLGLDWGIFVALAATVTLTAAGIRLRRKAAGRAAQAHPAGQDSSRRAHGG